jgi:hypothetical protein
MSSESFGSKDYETPEECSNSIDRLANRAELVDEMGNAHPNTPSNVSSLTESGREATVRDKVSKEEIGTLSEEE